MKAENASPSGAACPGTYGAIRVPLADLPPERILDAPCGEGQPADVQNTSIRAIG